MDHLISIYEHLPLFIKVPLWFLFNIVLLRGVLANEIMLEIQQHGLYKKGILDRSMKRIDKWYLLARKSAILQHYKFSHDGEVADCGEGRCTII